MGELTKQPGIGKVVEGQLNEVGIFTLEQLKQVGSKEAWLRIKMIGDSACINRLYGIEGKVVGAKNRAVAREKDRT